MDLFGCLPHQIRKEKCMLHLLNFLLFNSLQAKDDSFANHFSHIIYLHFEFVLNIQA